jgi:hypothetical protein
MSKLKTRRIDTATLLARYRAAAAAHGAATESGDYQTANRNHDLLAQIYRELRSRGTDAQHELLIFLNDIDPHVRAWAAAHSLEFAAERGEQVLRRLAAEPGVVGLNAEITLQEWLKGSLQFP